ncbi:MAG: hypothetical protein JXB38_11770 [Anaerolineales bacterium]|nr:hypothetical protein [Anaerolineales bacterium]
MLTFSQPFLFQYKIGAVNTAPNMILLPTNKMIPRRQSSLLRKYKITVASSNDQNSDNFADFNWFEYQGLR